MSAQCLGFYPVQLRQGWEERHLSTGVLPGAVLYSAGRHGPLLGARDAAAAAAAASE